MSVKLVQSWEIGVRRYCGGLNRHAPSALRTHEYSHLRVCGYCGLLGYEAQVVFVVRDLFVPIGISVIYAHIGGNRIDRRFAEIIAIGVE